MLGVISTVCDTDVLLDTSEIYCQVLEQIVGRHVFA